MKEWKNERFKLKLYIKHCSKVSENVVKVSEELNDMNRFN